MNLMWTAAAFFIFSIAGITGLFALKEWELRQGRVLAPELREKMDKLSFHLKELLFALQMDLEKLPPEILHISRTVLHETALTAAGLLRLLSYQAHRFADLVSHKHAFQRRAPRSEFLRKVIEHKRGFGQNEESDLEERD